MLREVIVLFRGMEHVNIPLFIPLWSWQDHCEVHSVHSMNADWWSRGRQPSDQANPTWRLHPPSKFIIITEPEGWYSFYRPIEGRRLSRPRWLDKWLPRWFNRPQTVTQPSTNRARHTVNTLIETNALRQHHHHHPSSTVAKCENISCRTQCIRRASFVYCDMNRTVGGDP